MDFERSELLLEPGIMILKELVELHSIYRKPEK